MSGDNWNTITMYGAPPFDGSPRIPDTFPQGPVLPPQDAAPVDVVKAMDDFVASEAGKKKGSGSQDYGTPWQFIRACEKRFGPFVCDLAAHAGNAKHEVFITKEENSLAQPWADRFPTGNLWLNPPFEVIDPWAEKCRNESKKRHGFIIMLTPASVGSRWFERHVKSHANVLPLMSRLAFDGQDGKRETYQKDLMIGVFGYGLSGFKPWYWKEKKEVLE